MSILKVDGGRARKVFGSRGATVLEVRIVVAFKEPKDVETLLDDFEETLADGHTPRELVQETIEALVGEKILIPVPDTLPGGEHTQAVFSSQLSSLGRQLDSLAGDLTAMGEWAQREVRVNGRDPISMLSSLRAEIAALRLALGEAQPRFVEEQTRGLAREPAGELRLHLGCGASRAPGWVNIDMLGGDVRLNLCRALPFADASVRYVYSAHTLEHFDYHTAAPRLLKEIHRVLAPGGTVRLAVPDIGAFLREVAARNEGFFREYDQTRPEFAGAAGYRTNLSKVMRLAGSATKSGWFFEHKMGYDLETLSDLLQAAGFESIEPSRYRSSRHEALQEIDATSAAGKLAYEGVANTLFVEATK
jgi:predicted SAM-dependent methyltransferase